jgi:hypothetical protein
MGWFTTNFQKGTQDLAGVDRRPYFCAKQTIMSEDHKEAEQNEIGGPVVVAIGVIGAAVLIIWLLGQ